MNRRQLTSKSVLIQFFFVLLALALVLYWQRDFFIELYLGQDQSRIGLVINFAIVILFVLGMTRVCILLVFYQREIDNIEQFNENLNNNREITYAVNQSSLISHRYQAFQQSRLLKSPVNHSALASVSVAEESSRLGFPKFVNNVLILTGVFGTIVSLSIALLGASSMIGSTTEIGGLGTVIQGMSSALSTTMTAIIAFFIFSYFYQCLGDVQTNCISRLEYVTTTRIVPMFHVEPDAMIKDYSDLIVSMAAVVEDMKAQQQQYFETAVNIENRVGMLTEQIGRTHEGFSEIIHLLKEGFRLSERDNEL